MFVSLPIGAMNPEQSALQETSLSMNFREIITPQTVTCFIGKLTLLQKCIYTSQGQSIIQCSYQLNYEDVSYIFYFILGQQSNRVLLRSMIFPLDQNVRTGNIITDIDQDPTNYVRQIINKLNIDNAWTINTIFIYHDYKQQDGTLYVSHLTHEDEAFYLLAVPYHEAPKTVVFYLTCFQPHKIDIFSSELEDFGENWVVEGITTMMACRLYTKAAAEKNEICDCCRKILRQNIGDDGWALVSHYIFSCSHVICQNCFVPKYNTTCPFCLKTGTANFIEEPIAITEKF